MTPEPDLPDGDLTVVVYRCPVCECGDRVTDSTHVAATVGERGAGVTAHTPQCTILTGGCAQCTARAGEQHSRYCRALGPYHVLTGPGRGR